jgi:hypothetical protein
MEVPWPAARSSSLPFRAPKANSSPPMWTRQRDGTILLTYGNEDGRGKLTMVRRLGRTLATMLATSGGAPSPGMAPVAAVVAGGPPSSSLTHKALE